MKIPKILVIGDLMLDHYIHGICDRISPEAPVPVVSKTEENYRLGGCGNVVNNLISLGGITGMVSVIGCDDSGLKLRNDLNSLELFDLILIEDERRPTTIKTRILADNHQILRLDEEVSTPIDSNITNKLINKIDLIISQYDAVVISDYAKGVITRELLDFVLKKCNQNSIISVIDPKGQDFSKYSKADFITPNKKELQSVCDWSINEGDGLKTALIHLKTNFKIKNPVVTLSSEGVAYLDQDEAIVKLPAEAKEVADVTGAGDTFIAALAIEIIRSKNKRTSINYANKAASLVVSKIGTSVVTQDEINEYCRFSILNFEFDKRLLETILLGLRTRNQRIVFTNGCFDILHRGHLKLLNDSASFGDFLVVGLNSDESVKILKGNDRPINKQDDRAYNLISLKAVDIVILFSQETPKELIQFINPDILVKGGDYSAIEIIGSEFANEVKIVPLENGFSTTEIIKKIRNGA
jgi:D-beta-D-heptose 7-phosphate kinase / D-beta-D-heptose 1-phosphate adenosyltransferase